MKSRTVAGRQADHDAIARDLFPNVVRRFIQMDAQPRNRGWRIRPGFLACGRTQKPRRKSHDPMSFILIPGGMAAKWLKRPIQSSLAAIFSRCWIVMPSKDDR